MKTVIINSSDLYEKIYTIISSAFSKDISNLKLTLNYDENDLSVDIEDTTSNLFNSEEYSKLIDRTKVIVFDYFFGLTYLQIDEKVTDFISLDISYMDEELIDSVFSDYSLKDYDTICAYEFSNNSSYNLVFINNYNDVEEDDITSSDTAYKYIELCINRNELISYTEWVDENYSYEIDQLKRYLGDYKESQYFDSYYAEERLRDNSNFFPDYDDFGEYKNDTYSYLVNRLYDEGKITELIKNALFNIDEDTYVSITDDILSKCEVDLKSNGIPNSESYLTIDSYTHYGFIYIESSEIQKWGEDYDCYDWLTEDKLDELITESDSDLDSYELWKIYTNTTNHDYEQEIEFDCRVYISYTSLLEIINNADLKYGLKSDDNTVWEEDEEE